MSIKLEIDRKDYQRYMYRADDKTSYAYCVLERDVKAEKETWNIEIFMASPTRQGHGSILLQYLLKHKPVIYTVCPITTESRAFFTKHGMIAPNYYDCKIFPQ